MNLYERCNCKKAEGEDATTQDFRFLLKPKESAGA
jgi:hypothetical protein